MRGAWFIAGFFTLGILQGQKLVEKSLAADQVRFIEIDAANCYRISLGTRPTENVEVVAHMDGEYAGKLMVSLEEREGTVSIRAGFLPGFMAPNDKLGAHKVVSISLEIFLPPHRWVRLRGTDCQVWASGEYRLLAIDLGGGSCHLRALSQRVEAHTQSGDIWLTTDRGVIRAISDHGRVLREDIPMGDPRFVLGSVEGDIHIQKTK